MAGRYGMSFAAKLLEEGKYEEAVVEATKAVDKQPENPLPLCDRAAAYDALERPAEAVADYEKAFALEVEAQVMETDVVDDQYFNAVINAATAAGKSGAGAWLDRYKRTLPEGGHLEEIDEWRARLAE